MRFGIFDKFGALNSVPVFSAFKKGLDRLGYQYASHDTSADVAVVWSVVWAGRMKNNREIWQLFRKSGRPVVVLEVGMIQRGHTWKVGVNGTTLGCYNMHDIDPDRVNKLKLSLKEWTNHGRDIVVALQRSDSQQWSDQPSVESWLNNIVKQLRSATERPIVVRTHPRQRIQFYG